MSFPQSNLLQLGAKVSILGGVTNGGGVGTTDWVDTNTDGLGDNWSKGNVEVSIVTGNGFNGNAQRAVRNIFTGTKDVYSDVYSVPTGINLYVRLKYRGEDTAQGYIELQVYDTSFGNLLLNEQMTNNTGNAVEYLSGSFVSSTGGLIVRVNLSNTVDAYFEIDEVNILS